MTSALAQVGLATGAVGEAPAGQARGSQGSRFDVAGDGAVMSEEAGEVVLVVGAAVAVLDAADVAGVDAAGGGLTANWVPVTTVTWAPSATMVGS